MEGIIIGYIVPHILYEDGIHPVDAGELYLSVDSNGYAAKSEIELKKKYPKVTDREPYHSFLPKEIVERWRPKCRVKVDNSIATP